MGCVCVCVCVGGVRVLSFVLAQPRIHTDLITWGVVCGGGGGVYLWQEGKELSKQPEECLIRESLHTS